MAITRATGFPINNQTSATSVSATWVTVGDAAILSIASFSASGDHITAVSSSKASGWTQIVTGADATDNFSQSVWLGTITSTGADTITVTWNTTPGAGAFEVVVDELNSGLGSTTVWSVVTSGTLRGTGAATNLFPRLTSNTVTLQAYWGYQIWSVSATGGTGTGFTFTTTATSNLITFDGALATSTSFQPSGSGTGGPTWAGAGIVSAALPAASSAAKQPVVHTTNLHRPGEIQVLRNPFRGTPIPPRVSPIVLPAPSVHRRGVVLVTHPPLTTPVVTASPKAQPPIVISGSLHRPGRVIVGRNPFTGLLIPPRLNPVVMPAPSVHRRGVIYVAHNGAVSNVVVATPKAQPPIVVSRSYRRPATILVGRNPFMGTIPTRQPTPIVLPRPFVRPHQTNSVLFPLIGTTAQPPPPIPNLGYLTVGPIEVITNATTNQVAAVYLDNGLTRPVHHLIVEALSGGVTGTVALVTTPDLIHWGVAATVTISGPGTYTTSWVGGSRYISAEILSLFSGSVSVWVSSSVTTGG